MEYAQSPKNFQLLNASKRPEFALCVFVCANNTHKISISAYDSGKNLYIR